MLAFMGVLVAMGMPSMRVLVGMRVFMIVLMLMGMSMVRIVIMVMLANCPDQGFARR
jgi:hypothetical protein